MSKGYKPPSGERMVTFTMLYLPALSATGQPLMPCHAARARQLIRNGKAIKKHDRGIVYLVLTERQTGETQSVAVGIDPGSKNALLIQSPEPRA